MGWDQSFAVFYQRLDDEHRGLFDGIFAVSASPGDAGVLSSLKTKVADHFIRGERVREGGRLQGQARRVSQGRGRRQRARLYRPGRLHEAMVGGSHHELTSHTKEKCNSNAMK